MAKSAYHHGDLRQTLLVAAEAELIDNGAEGFSLRRCAKRAGVSHAAPAHHFKDTAALLEALGADGFSRLSEAMRQVQPDNQLSDIAYGYIEFAYQNPQLYRLMFSTCGAAESESAIAKNADISFSVLVNAVRKIKGSQAFTSEDGWRAVSAIWSMLHGFADLSVAKRMPFVSDLPLDKQRAYIEDMMNRIIA